MCVSYLCGNRCLCGSEVAFLCVTIVWMYGGVGCVVEGFVSSGFDFV